MTRPMLTQREAATACGVSRSTIRRRREAGDLPGAISDETREWLVPDYTHVLGPARPNTLNTRYNQAVAVRESDDPEPAAARSADGHREVGVDGRGLAGFVALLVLQRMGEN